MYAPTWESVSSHPLPDWYDDAKLGILLHWGLYSVPGWAPVGADVGELFDAAVDRYVEYILLAGLAVYFRGSPVALMLCLGAVLGSFMVSYTTAKAEALGVVPPKGAMRRAERAVYVTCGCALAPIWELVMPGAHTVASISLGRELPIELALLVVAVVANVSAIRRTFRIAELIREKKPAA